MSLLAFTFVFFMLTSIADSQFCSDSSTCTNSKICLNSMCHRCHSSVDCETIVPETPYCNEMGPLGNSCEECLVDSHCPSPSKSRCYENVCSPCTQESDCSHVYGDRNQCLNGVCVGCFDHSQCLSGACDMDTYQCRGSACPCSLASTTPFCHGIHCMGCGASQTFCSSLNLYCTPDGSCQQCWLNDQCRDPALSRCAGTTCNACLEDNDCSHIRETNRCLTMQKCVACLNDFDCAPGETCINNVCVATSLTSYTIKLSYTEFPDIYIVDFPPELVANAYVQQGIAIELVDIDPTVYTYSIVKITETRYEIHFLVTQTIPATQLHLIYTFYSSIRYNINSQAHWDAQIPSKRIPYIGEREREISLTMQLLGQAFTVAFTVVSGLTLLLGGSPTIIWLLIGLIQTFYYLTFINVNYPANVQFFLRIFTLGKLEFIPNPMLWIDADIEEKSLPAPNRFEEYDVNGLFLEEAGNSLLIAFGVFLLYGMSLFVKKIMNRLSRLTTLLFTKISLWFRWSGALRGLIASYPDIAQASLLQIRELNFSAAIFSVSSVVGIICSIYILAFPIFTFLLVKKLTKDNGKIPYRFIGLVEDYNSEGTYAKYFTTVFLIKRLLIAVILVFLHDYSYIEITFLTILSCVTIFLLFKFKPYPTKDLNITNISSEILFLVVHVFIFVLIHDDHIKNFSEQVRLNIGWALISICGIILILNIRVTIIETIHMLKEYWSLMKKVLKIGNNVKKPRIKGIVPLGKVSPTESNSQKVPESMDTSTPNSSFGVNVAIVDTIPFVKKRKVARTGGNSVTIEHMKEFKFDN